MIKTDITTITIVSLDCLFLHTKCHFAANNIRILSDVSQCCDRYSPVCYRPPEMCAKQTNKQTNHISKCKIKIHTMKTSTVHCQAAKQKQLVINQKCTNLI